MKKEDYPNYFNAADDLSIKAQKRYLFLMKINSWSMIVASALSIYNWQETTPMLCIYIITGFLFLVTIISSLILALKKYENIWYRGRALAESCKTLTWRFITCSELFENNIDTEEIERRFKQRIKEIYNKYDGLAKDVDTKNLSHKHIITEEMRRIRNLPTVERKDYYITYRIKEQKDWYANKAENNNEKYRKWYILIILFQILSLISIIYLVKVPDCHYNFIGLFTTIAASAIGWMQLKQHQELKQAYTTAAEELNYIEELSDSITTEEKLSAFVLDAENAISREHTLWLAQYRKI